MVNKHHDPRSEAEKARAELKRNSEMGTAVSQSPLTQKPSVTPKTFGAGGKKASVRSGTDQGLEAGGAAEGTTRSAGSQSPTEAEQVSAGRDRTRPAPTTGDDDVLSRAKE
jgi:hypothetical protein